MSGLDRDRALGDPGRRAERRGKPLIEERAAYFALMDHPQPAAV